MKSIKKIILSLADRNLLLRRMIMRTMKRKRKRRFHKYYKKNKIIDEKLIAFEVFSGRAYACNPKALYEQMLKEPRFDEYIKVWAFRDPERYQFLAKNRNTIVVKSRSDEYYDYFSKAKYWITNFRAPDEFEKKEEQIFLQTWHGVPLKRMGYDIESYKDRTVSTKQLRNEYTKAAKQFTYMLSVSDYYKEKLTSAFGLSRIDRTDIFLDLGYPRNDFLYKHTEADRERVREKLRLEKGKKHILYCPTFRDNQYKVGVGNTLKLGIDFEQLQEEIGEEYTILFRAHYLVKNQFDFEKYAGFIIDVSDYADINDLYIVSDVLVTDYSSVMFDFSILEKPIILYMYDLEEYQNSLRNFYCDLSEMPSQPIQTQEELVEEIFASKDFVVSKKYKEFKERHNTLNGPNTSTQILDVVFK